MNIKVLSYSLSGNNAALARSLAAKLSAEHIEITELKLRNTLTIILDTIFNRTPPVEPATDSMVGDLIIFVGPVWLGQVATPFRAYLKQIRTKPVKYAFVSISGGALGQNAKISRELEGRTGLEPAAVVNLFIADLLPANPKPNTKDTSTYKLKSRDVKNLTNMVMDALNKVI